MRLRSVEIKGFKSFAQATQINFGEDITGIVGPNGSGKSNIIDAIRWVLGEQKSKELRLASMSDVLFNGTKRRRSANSAQVTLRFENTKNVLPTDYSEVAISRVLYRNGDSEYRINNVVCRLKDIRELFLDSGIGSNSYAIIALGMVDDLLSDREGARRNMFEQAAGISKYKQHKKEALRKLKHTEEDLLRLDDLIYEIEGNLKSLEKQARRAKRFIILKEEYKAIALDSAASQIKEFKKSYNTLREKIQAQKAEYEMVSAQINKIDAQIVDKKSGHLHLEKNLSEVQKDINHLISRIRNLESDVKSKEEKLSYLRNALKEDHQVLDSSQSKAEELAKEFTKNQNKKKEIKSKLDKESIVLQESKILLEGFQTTHLSNKERIHHYTSELKSKQEKLVSIERSVAVAENEESNINRQLKTAKDDSAKFEAGVKQLQASLRSSHELFDIAANKFQQLVNDLEQRDQQKKALQSEKEKLKDELSQLGRQLDAKGNEKNLLKNMIDSLEGFPESTKFLSSSKKWLDKVILVSDLIVCDEKYRIALENYLENYLNAFVVETREQAIQGIELLRNHQKGRATFLINSQIPELEGNQDKLPFMSASSVVDSNENYKPLLNWLLRDVYFVDDLSIPSEYKNSDNHTFLSIDGHICQRQLELKGGSVGLFEGKKIGRTKQFKVLEKEIKSLSDKSAILEDKYEQLKTRLAQNNSEQDIKQQLEKSRREKSDLQNQMVKLEAELKNKTEQNNTLQSKIESFENRLLELRIKISELRKEQKEDLQAHEDIKQQTDKLDEAYQIEAQKFNQLSSTYNEQNIKFIRSQNELKSIENEEDFLLKQEEDLKVQLNRLRAKAIGNKNEQKQLLAAVEEGKLTLKQWYDQRQHKEQALTSVEKDYFQAKGEVMKMEDEVKQLNKKALNCQQLIDQLREKFLEVKVEMNRIVERAEVEFGIQEEELMQHEASSDLPEQELRAKTIKLRSRIEQFGEVNPMAIDAYDEIHQRYVQMDEQRKDVIEAKQILLKTIDEIEETAQEKFMVAFHQVKHNFQKVFRTLFTQEDTCDLVLTRPEAPLLSPIEIIAKPKGKRPKTLAQLSGGEKTLTAVALLFSLYLIKPAPFCIFDEVDAPLDDANIEKFNRIIREFSGDSQFVIVTHNKLTMAAVDVIYGVYMEEMGVSNVSAVDFRQFDNEVILEAV